MHDDVPGNVAADMVQEYGDARAAIDAAPHVLELDLEVERSASMPMEGKGVHARWDADDRTLRVHTSTQASTSVRAALSAKLEISPDRIEVIAPDVGGGFGVKIVHPWPEEVLIPWAAIRLDHEVKWVEDRREHFISSAHEREQHPPRPGRLRRRRACLLGLDVTIWHDHGAYTPYGLIVPINSSTQLLGPYKPGAYRVEFFSLYTNTVIVTPYRGAGRPQGVFAMERTMDAIADELGLDRAEVRSRNFIQPDEMPWDYGLIFQDGRPLVYDSGDFPASLDKIKKLVGWDDFDAFRAQAEAEGRRVGIGLGCYVEGTGPGPYEGGWVRVQTDGGVVVATGLTSQGQGHKTAFAQIVADELGVPIERVSVTTGDTRRFRYAVGHVRFRAGRRERQRHRARRSAGAGEGAAHRRRRARGRPRGSGDRRRHSAGQGRAGTGDLARHGGGAVQPAAVRLRRGVEAGHPVRRQRRLRAPAGPRRRGARTRGHRLLLADPFDVRQRHACRDRRDRPGDRGDPHPAVLRRA